MCVHTYCVYKCIELIQSLKYESSGHHHLYDHSISCYYAGALYGPAAGGTAHDSDGAAGGVLQGRPLHPLAQPAAAEADRHGESVHSPGQQVRYMYMYRTCTVHVHVQGGRLCQMSRHMHTTHACIL